MGAKRLGAALGAAVGIVVLALAGVAAAGEKYAVFGGDTTPQERQELAQLFGVPLNASVQAVTTPPKRNRAPYSQSASFRNAAMSTCGFIRRRDHCGAPNRVRARPPGDDKDDRPVAG